MTPLRAPVKDPVSDYLERNPLRPKMTPPPKKNKDTPTGMDPHEGWPSRTLLQDPLKDPCKRSPKRPLSKTTVKACYMNPQKRARELIGSTSSLRTLLNDPPMRDP